MSRPLPVVYLARHGETEWSLTGQHTGLTDLPLTGRGEENARRLGKRLAGLAFARVFTSPLQRAKRSCELAGFGPVAQIDGDLVEWNYGKYEGRKTDDIRRERPGWSLFRDGCPEGENVADVAARADRVIARLRSAGGDALVFSSGHILRVLAARWCALEGRYGACLHLNTATLSTLGYEHAENEPVIRIWNDAGHLQ